MLAGITHITGRNRCSISMQIKNVGVQIKQLVQIVEKSDAGFIILGGDFNFDPYVNNYRPQNDSESTLEDIQKVMVNSMEDFLKTAEVSS